MKNIVSKFIFLVSIVFIAPTPAISYATEYRNEFEKIYGTCTMTKEFMNNAVVAECSNRASDKAKSEINKQYGLLLQYLRQKSPEDVPKLEASQREWIKYRDNFCDLKGSIVGMPMYGYCRMEFNIGRAIELRALNEEKM